MQNNVILIDICGTLFQSNTTFDFLDFFIKNQSYRYFRKIMQTHIWHYFNSIIYKITHIDLSRKIALSYLKGISKEKLLLKADEFYSQYLEQRKIKEVWQLIETLKSNTTTLVLVSGTIDPIAQIVSKKINIPIFISSKLAYKNNFCQGKLKLDALHSKSKLLLKQNITLPYQHIITDNPGDITLIKQSKNATIVIYNNLIRWKHLIKKQTNINYITPSINYEFKR